jgi:hypothetical protein
MAIITQFDIQTDHGNPEVIKGTIQLGLGYSDGRRAIAEGIVADSSPRYVRWLFHIQIQRVSTSGWNVTIDFSGQYIGDREADPELDAAIWAKELLPWIE